MGFLQLLRELIFLAAYVGTPHSFPGQLPAAEERVLLQRNAAGDPEAREKLIVHNLRLVAHIAKKYARRGRDADDIISIGTIGLIKAVTTFDASKGAPLSAYASRCVENEILMSLRTEKKQVPEVSLSDAIGVDGDGNDISLSDVLGTDAEEVELSVENRLAAESVRNAMERVLTDREQTVVQLRFGLGGACRMPQREVAKLLGISRSYISRIEKKALGKLFDEFRRNPPK